jgi:hypothetical protein
VREGEDGPDQRVVSHHRDAVVLLSRKVARFVVGVGVGVLSLQAYEQGFRLTT